MRGWQCELNAALTAIAANPALRWEENFFAAEIDHRFANQNVPIISCKGSSKQLNGCSREGGEVFWGGGSRLFLKAGWVAAGIAMGFPRCPDSH